MNDSLHIKYTLIAELLRSLEAEGFVFGVDKHLQLQALVNQLPEDTPTEDLKEILCPAIASSEQSQALVYAVFDRSLERVLAMLGLEKERKEEKKEESKWLLAAILLVGLLLTPLAVYLWFPQPQDKEVSKSFTVYRDSTLHPVCLDSAELALMRPSIQRAYFALNGKSSITTEFGTYVLDDKFCLSFTAGNSLGRDSVTAYYFSSGMDSILVHFKPTIQEQVVENDETASPIVAKQEYLFTFKAYPVPVDIRTLEAEPPSNWETFYLNNAWWLKIAFAFLASLLLALILLLRERNRRNLVAELESNDNPPFVWNIQTGEQPEIDVGFGFNRLLQNMRQRTATEHRLLSIPRTIKATIRKGGMVDFRYASHTRPLEYLFLIGQPSANSHRAHLYDYLYRRIRESEVHIERFFFENDLRVCWNEQRTDGIQLKDLYQLYPNARLIIIGNGYQLLNPLTGKLSEWAKVFAQWKQRAILTPVPTSGWGRRESELEKRFGMVPASLQGFDFLARQMDLGEDASYDTWTEEVADAPSIPVELEDHTAEELHLFYPPKLVHWIAVCAVFPSLHWNLTLELGKLLSSPDYPLLTVENINQLNRLSWFDDGKIPNEARASLIGWLENKHPDILHQARAAIDGLLRQNPPPPDSAAFEEYLMNRNLNEWLITANRKRKKQLEREIAQQLEAGAEPDFTAVKYLNRPWNPLDFIVPQAWRKYVYKGGFTGLGMRGRNKDLFWALPLWLLLIGATLWWRSTVSQCEGLMTVYQFEKVNYLPTTNEQNTFLYTTLPRVPEKWKHKDTSIIFLAAGSPRLEPAASDNVETAVVTDEETRRAQIIYTEIQPQYNKDSITICNDSPEKQVIVNQYLTSGAIYAKDYGLADSLLSATQAIYEQAAPSANMDSLYEAYRKNVATDYWNRAIPFFRLAEDKYEKQDSSTFFQRDSACFFFQRAWALDSTDAEVNRALRWCNSEVVAGFSPSADYCCIPCEISFSNTSIDAVYYEWDFGDGNASAEASPTHVFQKGGNYAASLMAIGIDGKRDAATRQILVLEPIDFQILANSTIFKTGTPVVFSTTAARGTISWDFGDGEAAENQPAPRHAYNKAGTYRVVAVLNDLCGREEASLEITVEQGEVPSRGREEPLTELEERSNKQVNATPDQSTLPENQQQAIVPHQNTSDDNGAAARFRCMWRTDPATSMVVGWDQEKGNNPILFYDVIDFGTQVAAYRNQRRPDRIILSRGMNNHFVRLSGLQHNTVYYFVIQSSNGVSQRYSFKTAPNTPTERLSIIAGGDSRNNRSARRDANQLVSKLRPHCVIFTGDMTGGDTAPEWREWFDDWQETIGSDGRIFPIIPARGNHERDNGTITELFDVISSDVYYGLTLGGNLFRIYTLNTLMPEGGSQRIWLEGDLKANRHIIWKMAQYHQAMRPHTRAKPEHDELVVNWAPLFYQYSMNLVIESDAHVVKQTHPIRPDTGPGSDEGFIRDDDNGTVYIGEGCWGAPLRENNDDKSWTRASQSFNQFSWIFVDQEKMEIRVIRTDRSEKVAEVSQSNIFEPPLGLTIWNPPTGDVLTIRSRKAGSSSPDSGVSPPIATLENDQPTSRPASSSSDIPREPEPAGDDPSDWSLFPKVVPDEKGDITIKYYLPQNCDVTIQLINPKWQPVAKMDFLRQPRGDQVKSLNLSRVPSGKYLLVIKGGDRLARRFQVIVR